MLALARAQIHVSALLLALLGAAGAVFAQDARPLLDAERHLSMRPLVSSGSTVLGEPIRYPSGSPAHVTMLEIVLTPGQQTGWHTHPVPLAAYVLEGELTVDYGPKGKRIYRAGDAFIEAVEQPHDGSSTGEGPARLLVVVIGAEGLAASVPAPPPH
ncbi:MAG: cupin domain-containing protein [Xanthobacteraceae bacterium]